MRGKAAQASPPANLSVLDAARCSTVRPGTEQVDYSISPLRADGMSGWIDR